MNRHVFASAGIAGATDSPFCNYREAVEGQGIRACFQHRASGIHIGSARPDLCQWCWAVEGMTQQCTCKTDCNRPKCPRREEDFDFRAVPVPRFLPREPAPETEETDHAA